MYLTLSINCVGNFHVKLPRVLQGDGEQLHPDLQRILELELNDYHFLRLGLEFLHKAMEIHGGFLWTWSLYVSMMCFPYL